VREAIPALEGKPHAPGDCRKGRAATPAPDIGYIQWFERRGSETDETMRSRAGLILAALAGLVVSACGGGGAPQLDRATFEDVMVALRTAQQETDSAGFDGRRVQILDSAGVTDSLLLGFVRAHATDVRFMSEVWESIDGRVNGRSRDEAGADTVMHR
jgi:hypothetical protein